MAASRSVLSLLRHAGGATGSPTPKCIKTTSRTFRHLTTSSTPRLSTLKLSPPRHIRHYSSARPRTKFEETYFFRPGTWIISGIFFTFLGATSVIMSVRDFVAYTDAESLENFTPEHPKQHEIEGFINSHPLTLSLRKEEKYRESRPTLKINEAYRNASLTSGVLSGPGRIEVPPYVWTEEGGKSLVSILYLGPELCGYPGLVHGGLLATLLDEGLARCSFEALPNGLGMTASLTINYRKPSPAENYVVLRAKTVKVEGRKAWVEGHIETLPMNGEAPVVLVEAEALMIEPKQANMLKSLVSVA